MCDHCAGHARVDVGGCRRIAGRWHRAWSVSGRGAQQRQSHPAALRLVFLPTQSAETTTSAQTCCRQLMHRKPFHRHRISRSRHTTTWKMCVQPGLSREMSAGMRNAHTWEQQLIQSMLPGEDTRLRLVAVCTGAVTAVHSGRRVRAQHARAHAGTPTSPCPPGQRPVYCALQ